VLGLGRIAGIMSIISLVYFSSIKKAKWKVVTLIILIASLFVLLLTGSRMPFIALLLSVFVMLFFYINLDMELGNLKINKRLFNLFYLVPIIIVFIVFLLKKGSIDVLINRLLVLNKEGGGASASSRTNLLNDSIS